MALFKDLNKIREKIVKKFQNQCTEIDSMNKRTRIEKKENKIHVMSC
jgi:hypothetical protein